MNQTRWQMHCSRGARAMVLRNPDVIPAAECAAMQVHLTEIAERWRRCEQLRKDACRPVHWIATT